MKAISRGFSRAVVAMGSEEWIGVDDLPDVLKRDGLRVQPAWFPPGLSYHELVEAFKRHVLGYAFASHEAGKKGTGHLIVPKVFPLETDRPKRLLIGLFPKETL
ncbi:MAG TPA: hypothetical protein VER98_15130 [Terriglobia bacterium]|nr:hypothetical protein [Terriglobia bacterium]